MRATRAEVAKLAGVSPSVVSYVLNGGPRNVAPETRRRVEEAIASLEYRPNAIAQALRGGRSGAIGVIVGHGKDHVFGALSLSLQKAAQSSGYAMYVSFAGDAATERQYARSLVDRQIDGLIAIELEDPAVLTSLHEDGLPVALVSDGEGSDGILQLRTNPAAPMEALMDAIAAYRPGIVLYSVDLVSSASTEDVEAATGSEVHEFRVDTIAGGTELVHLLRAHAAAVVMCATDTELERVLWLAGSVGIDIRHQVFTTSRIDYRHREFDEAEISVKWDLDRPTRQVFAELIQMIDDPDGERIEISIPWQVTTLRTELTQPARVWDVADI